MECTGKTAIVTGAAGQGMGRSIALTLAREGARVVINYLKSAESAAAIVQHIESRGGSAIAFQADINQHAQCQALVQAAENAFGQVDICIIGPGGGWHPESIEDLHAADALDDAVKELAPLYNLMPPWCYPGCTCGSGAGWSAWDNTPHCIHPPMHAMPARQPGIMPFCLPVIKRGQKG